MLADVGMGKTYSKSAHVMTWVLHGPALLLSLEETFLHTLCIDGDFYSRVGEICAA